MSSGFRRRKSRSRSVSPTAGSPAPQSNNQELSLSVLVRFPALGANELKNRLLTYNGIDSTLPASWLLSKVSERAGRSVGTDLEVGLYPPRQGRRQREHSSVTPPYQRTGATRVAPSEFPACKRRTSKYPPPPPRPRTPH